MRDVWGARIDRAKALAEQDEAARPLMLVYGDLLVLQRECFDTLWQRANKLSGSFARDLVIVNSCAGTMLSALSRIGPPLLAEQARRWMAQGESAVESMLVTSWRTSSTRDFLGRLVMQPYAQCLALAGVPPVDREMTRADNLCPFCGGAPQVSILDGSAASNRRARHLECGTCSTAWVFPEPRCVYCGETEPRRIGHYQSPAFEHTRVDTCDACQHYLKSIDLDRLESAVPVVDEVAAATLDAWARDHGYQKIELNIVEL
jgi:formate dehydrogenase accessory protein FdhE